MALKATVFRCALDVSDIDRNHYGQYPLVVARHPSETDERMMVRILAFALNAQERLEFGRGVSATDEPALWCHDLTGAVSLWIDLGQPEPRQIARACGRAEQVRIYTWEARKAEVWWRQNAAVLERHRNLEVWHLAGDAIAGLASRATRSLDIQCTVQDGVGWISVDDASLELRPERWHPAA